MDLKSGMSRKMGLGVWLRGAEHLPSKCKALGSGPALEKKGKKAGVGGVVV